MLQRLSLLLPLVLAPAVQAVPQEHELTPWLSLRTEGCEAFLVDAKDQRLRAALDMLDARLRELPGEIPDFDAPPDLISLGVRLFGGPMSLTVSESSRAIPGMPIPLAGELRLTQGNRQEARATTREIVRWLKEFGVDLGKPEGNDTWTLPAPVPAWLGVHNSATVLRVGLEEGVKAPSQKGLLPKGAELSFSGMMDYGAILGMVESFAGGDPEWKELMGLLSTLGLEDIEYAWAFGIDDERSHFVFDMPDWAATAVDAGILSDEELQPDVVALIPEDATWATAVAFDLGGIFGMYRDMFQHLGEVDLDALVAEHTGLDIQRDLVAPLGGSAAMYASDSTGGGGLLSTVALIELDDTEAFRATFGRLEKFTGDVGRTEMGGYIRFSHFEERGLDFGVLSFPGLPVPFELCFTTVNDFAVFGVTPQAVQAAAFQITAAERSLLDNEDFQTQLGPDMSGVLSISWINTPRLMQDGYGTLSLLTSAVANMVRSPRDAGREPGLLMPSYPELRTGAKGILTIGRRVGDDFRSETRADRSQLVNAAGISGYVYNSPFLAVVGVGLMAGVAVPRVMSQLQMAEAQAQRPYVFDLDEPVPAAEVEPAQEPVDYEDRVADDFIALYEALDHYAANNGGRYPDGLRVLTIADENGARYLDPKHLVDPWGDPYLYTAPSPGNPEPEIDLMD